MTKRTLLIAVTCLLATGASAADAAKRKSVRLRAFSSCSSLINYGNSNAKRVLGTQQRNAQPMPTGGGQGVSGGGEDGGGTMTPTAAPAPAAGGAPEARTPVAGEDFSGTNVQEEGIDEPDIVKTDGKRIFALAAGKLRVLDATGDGPKLVATLQIGDGSAYGHTMLLYGDTLMVAYHHPQPRPQEASGGGGDAPTARPAQSPAIAPAPDFYPGYYEPQTILAEVSVADPANPRLVRSITTDGTFANARLNGRFARVVISTPPRAIYEQPQADGTRSTKSADWRAMSKIRRGGRTSRKVLVKCRNVRRTSSFSGFGMISVITFDLSKGLVPVDSDALMTEAQTIYASEKNLYVATQRYSETWANPDGSRPPAQLHTAIHRFDISEPGRTNYTSSGEVNGYLLNQFSLSEHEGKLRVASTEQPTWFGGESLRASESFVTVLEEQGTRLVRLGAVSGLGKGERIYSVRFIGEKGYVVTFRQVDPLYTLDLSNPASPKVMGELKILGYSAYLHPAGNDLLIGIGQDATEEGRRAGAQLSLFDVSDIRNPTRLQAYKIGGSSDAEYDHHAFLYWPATNLAVLPIQIYGDPQPMPAPSSDPNTASSAPAPPPNHFAGAVGLTVKREAISETGKISHPSANSGYAPAISRSLVIGKHLYTLSDAGVKSSALDTLADEAFVPFG